MAAMAVKGEPRIPIDELCLGGDGRITSRIAGLSPSPRTTDDGAIVSYINQGQVYNLVLNCSVPTQSIFNSTLSLRIAGQGAITGNLFGLWLANNPGKHLLDYDPQRTVNAHVVRADAASVTFDWNQPEVSIAFRVNCLSTDFTERQRGGEKGVALVLAVTTAEAGQHVGSAECSVKVFKGGAERKLKTDHDRVIKEGLMSPQGLDRDTLLRPAPYASPLLLTSPEPRRVVDMPDVVESEWVGLPDPITPHGSINASFAVSSLHLSPDSIPGLAPSMPLSAQSSPSQVQAWLIEQGFGAYCDRFVGYDGRILLRLTKSDLVAILGDYAQAARLYILLQDRAGPCGPLTVNMYTQTADGDFGP
eukprot:m.63666 g.63666  ORF g.63666 m.63666 type:complete len:362 (+) comp12480_c1_seq1:12-1097(+)